MNGAWWIPVIISFALLLLTAMGAVAAWVQARTAVEARRDALAAQSASEAARDETIALARQANTELARQAAAQERANEIEESKLPKRAVRWRLEHPGGDIYALRNTGDALAERVTVHELQLPAGRVRHRNQPPTDVAPRGVFQFRALFGLGSAPIELEVRWYEGDGAMKADSVTITS